MSVQHVDAADPNIHEPKGCAAAAANTTYVANGAGSGAWSLISSAMLNTSSIISWIQGLLTAGTLTTAQVLWVHHQIADISTAGSVLIPIPANCTVDTITMVLGGAIATADATITVTNAAAASLGTGVTVAFTSSAKGDTYTFTATSNNVMTGPTWIEVATDGASTNTVTLDLVVKMSIAA